MICETYGEFRNVFAITVEFTRGSVVFEAPDYIENLGSDDDLEIGMYLQIAGSSLNDGQYLIVDLSGGDQTWVDPDYNAIVDDTGETATFTGFFLAFDGYKQWPVDYLRINGFDAGLTINWVHPVTGNPTSETLPGNSPLTAATDVTLAADTGTGTDDDYNWYLSKRREIGEVYDDIAITKDPTNGNAVIISFPNHDGNALTPKQVYRLLGNCHLYVQRKSDKAIQWFDLGAHLS